MQSYETYVAGYRVVVTGRSKAAAQHAARQFANLDNALLSEIAAEDAKRFPAALPRV